MQVIVVKADEPWKEGPSLLDSDDGVLLFVSQGARWINNEPTRLAALKRLGKRGGAYVAIHWGMGTVETKNIEDFVNLFGGCPGDPDRLNPGHHPFPGLDLRVHQCAGGNRGVAHALPPRRQGRPTPEAQPG